MIGWLFWISVILLGVVLVINPPEKFKDIPIRGLLRRKDFCIFMLFSMLLGAVQLLQNGKEPNAAVNANLPKKAEGRLFVPTKRVLNTTDLILTLGNNTFRSSGGNFLETDQGTNIKASLDDQGRILLNCTLCDRYGDILLVVQDNQWKVRPDNSYTIIDKPNAVRIEGKDGERIVEAILTSTTTATIYGDFWLDSMRIIADESGMMAPAEIAGQRP